MNEVQRRPLAGYDERGCVLIEYDRARPILMPDGGKSEFIIKCAECLELQDIETR